MTDAVHDEPVTPTGEGTPPVEPLEVPAVEPVASAPTEPDQTGLSDTDDALAGEPSADGDASSGAIEKRFRKITLERERWKARAEAFEAAATGRAPAAAPEPPAPPPPNLPPKPSQEQFETYEEYVEALGGWAADKRFIEREHQYVQSQRQTEEGRRASKARDWFSKGQEKYDDFDEVARSSSVPITPFMAEAMVEAGDVGTDMAYFLGQNPKEASRISSLPPLAQIRELGKLEAKLTAPAPPLKTKSTAPPPIAPVVQSGEAHLPGLDELPLDDFMKRRNAEVRRK
jgi:hypothetical protein